MGKKGLKGKMIIETKQPDPDKEDLAQPKEEMKEEDNLSFHSAHS
jgi:hypothetical protein